MKKILILLLANLCVFYLQSQNTYFKRYENLTDLDNEAVLSINKINDDYIYLFSVGAFDSADPYN